MNKAQKKIVAEAKKVVTKLLKNSVPPIFSFHNVAHTQDVAKAAQLIEEYYQLSDEDRFIVFIAAWFHDTGFSTGAAEGHEQESVRLVTAFLQQHNTDAEVIHQVAACIQATRLPQAPLTILEKIICDADLYHLGTGKFKIWSARLRRELKHSDKAGNTEEEWRQADIDLLISHNYHTEFCQQQLEPVKQGWVKKLQQKQIASKVDTFDNPHLK